MVDRVLVTGAAGFIGSHLCEALLDQGYQVIGLDCFTDYYDPALKRANVAPLLDRPGFTLLEADLLTMDYAPLLREVDQVYHLAGQPGVRGSWGRLFEEYTRNNVLATQRLLEAALTAGGRPVVYASSSSTYGNQAMMPLCEDMAPAPISPYGVTKLAAEHLCRLYHDVHGLPTVALRLFTVYGPRQRPDMAFSRFLAALQDGREITIFGDGDQTRDFTYVGDVVRAFQLAMRFCCEYPGDLTGAQRVFNVAGGARASVRQVLSLAEEIADREFKVRYLPAQPGDVRDTWADTTRSWEALSFRADVGLCDGLTAQWRALTGQPARS